MRLLKTSRCTPVIRPAVRCSMILSSLMLSLAAVPAHAQRSSSRTALTPRIAFVNLEQLFDSVPGRNAVASGFADELRMAETRVRLAADSLQRSVEAFSQQQQGLTPTQREAATLTLRARELQLEDMVQRLNASVLVRREALQAPLKACVQRAMRVVQERDGWHAIADREALGALFVLSSEADVTKQVLDVLRGLGTEPCRTQ